MAEMSRKISLKETPVIDTHCFAYGASSLSRQDLGRQFELGGPTVGSIDPGVGEGLGKGYAENTVPFKKMIKDLSEFLSCAPTTEEVLRAREARASDFEGYIRALMADAGVKTLIVDNASGTLGEVDEFGGLFPGEVRKTLRLETLIRDILESNPSFEALISAFDEALQNAVVVEGCVAFKTVIAYRTGLDIQMVSEVEAEKDFSDRAQRTMWFGAYVKRVRDYLVRRALVKSIDLGVPLLIHTGLGDTDIVASRCNPALLLDLLRDDEVLPASVVLIHGGFPYTYEAGWLANVLPNVYFELSAGLPPYMEPAVSTRRYGEVLQWVPPAKLLYGSDAANYPENVWYYATVAKRAMAAALDDLIEEGVLTLDEALAMGEDVFFNNARRLFRL